MGNITIYQPSEADYYNAQASVSGTAKREAEKASRFALKLMAQHLYMEHGVKINTLAKRLGLKRNTLRELLKEI